MSEIEETQLEEDIVTFEHDPLGYVLYAFPWGEAGTVLADEQGPRTWQKEFLESLGEKLRAGEQVDKAMVEAIQMAVASGHDIGKSALVSWLILWALSTRENTRGVVTANTDTQLRTKTWPEVTKWWGLSINRHWFVCPGTSLYSSDPKCEKTWRVDAIPWSENNTEAFAGLHNKGSRILIIFDEASAIADAIWEVTQGALKDENTQMIWAVFGNPTRNTGRFRECFGKLAHRWNGRQIDSRTVEGVNQIEIKKDVEDWGEDSDYIRVRVRGVFPRAGIVQFIASDIANAAASTKRKPVCNDLDPIVIGVDVARYGPDQSVIAIRKGRDARTFPWKRFRGMDTMQLAAQVVLTLNQLAAGGAPADAVFVDEGGIGGAVIDRLRQLGYRVIGVNNGSAADGLAEGELCRNKGAECWARMRRWLGNVEDGGALPYDSPRLVSELESREYWIDDKSQIVLERKEDMAERGVGSPDEADALALTFAQNVGSHGSTTLARANLGDGFERPAPKRFDPLARVRRRG